MHDIIAMAFWNPCHVQSHRLQDSEQWYEITAISASLTLLVSILMRYILNIKVVCTIWRMYANEQCASKFGFPFQTFVGKWRRQKVEMYIHSFCLLLFLPVSDNDWWEYILRSLHVCSTSIPFANVITIAVKLRKCSSTLSSVIFPILFAHSWLWSSFLFRGNLRFGHILYCVY